MSFEIITVENRIVSMINTFRGICTKVTDFLPGSVLRSKFETVAVEMEEQDFQWLTSAKKAIPVSLYQAFNFSLEPARVATGKVTFNGSSTKNILIPTGTRVTTSDTPPVVFETVVDGTILIGQTSVSIPVTAIVSGSSGNVISGSVAKLIGTIQGVTSVTNPLSFTSGADEELEEDRRTRFNEFIVTLSRGTSSSIERGAKTAKIYNLDGEVIEQTLYARVLEPYLTDNTKPVSEVYCYVYNGFGSTTQDLVDETQKIVDGYYESDGTPIEGYKAAGVICHVVPAVERALDVTLSITPLEVLDDDGKESLRIQAVQEIEKYFRTLGPGSLFNRARLQTDLMNSLELLNYSNSLPSSDVSLPITDVHVPGVLTVTVL